MDLIDIAVVGLLITKLRDILLSLLVNFFKSVNTCQNYKQECHCLMHFLPLLAKWWPGAQSARNNHVPACNFAKCSSI